MSIDDAIEKFEMVIEAQAKALKETSLIIGKVLNGLDDEQYYIIEKSLKSSDPNLINISKHLLSQFPLFQETILNLNQKLRPHTKITLENIDPYFTERAIELGVRLTYKTRRLITSLNNNERLRPIRNWEETLDWIFAFNGWNGFQQGLHTCIKMITLTGVSPYTRLSSIYLAEYVQHALEGRYGNITNIEKKKCKCYKCGSVKFIGESYISNKHMKLWDCLCKDCRAREEQPILPLDADDCNGSWENFDEIWKDYITNNISIGNPPTFSDGAIIIKKEIENNYFILDSESGRHIIKIYVDLVNEEHWGDVDHQAYCPQCDKYFEAEHTVKYAIRTAEHEGDICNTCYKKFEEE